MSRAIQKSNGIFGLMLFVAMSFAAPGLSAVLSLSGPGDWYDSLTKPWFNPPNWIFGPVWTVLYLSIGVSGWLVWRVGEPKERFRPLSAFAFQWVLNAIWTPLFFGMQRPDIALIDILALWIAIAVTVALFFRVSRLAAALLVPYWLWVSFAALLNASLWWLNK